MSLTESSFIGLCLEGFLCGLYSGIFVMYIQHQTSRQDSHKMNNVIFYALCVLYILSVGTVVLDSSTFLIFEPNTAFHLFLIDGAVVGCCDFIAQSILIYRCWIVWGRNIHVAITPSILTFAFLATWLAVEGSVYVYQDIFGRTYRGFALALTSIIISFTTNALVTGLIVFKISKVYQEVKATLDVQNLGVTGGSKLRSIMFIIIESGMALFAIQLVQIVLYILESNLAKEAYDTIIGICQMLNGIAPTIILVRVSMGFSFHDKESMIESITESLHFATENMNLNPETGRIGIGRHESRDELDDVDVQPSNDSLDIQMVTDEHIVYQ